MGFRIGFFVGAGVGYYLGAKAGRQRYDQINRTVRKVKRSDAFEAASGKAKSTLEGGVDKARELVSSKVGGGHDPLGSRGNGSPP